MERVAVQSSMIQAVGYDAQTRVLEVAFNSGHVYRYTQVPPTQYAGLLAADSKGAYMHEHIIDLYPYYALGRRRR